MSDLETRVLKKVLSLIGTGKEHTAAPDEKYLKSLEDIGYIKMGWDNELTQMGRDRLRDLQDDDW